jgi:uncharacterized protein YegL
VLDVSGSMAGQKIDQLNFAIQEALPAMRDIADSRENASVEVRVLTFSSGTNWMTPAPVPLATFTWTPVSAGGVTDMGAALRAMAQEFDEANMPARGMPPVVVLVTDGQPTDNFEAGRKAFMDQRWGEKAVRLGIGVGQDADHEVLRKFIAHPEIEPLQASNAGDLVKFIKWASTEALKAASTPTAQASGDDTPTVKMDGLGNAPKQEGDIVW